MDQHRAISAACAIAVALTSLRVFGNVGVYI
jgi:hypothetical protein